ncbi:hypothetical protein Tco_0755443 [Tanacetum coccineum]
MMLRALLMEEQVTSRFNHHLTTDLTLEIPLLAPILPDQLLIFLPEEDIPIGRLYRTHPVGTCRALTARKYLELYLSHRLAFRNIETGNRELESMSLIAGGEESYAYLSRFASLERSNARLRGTMMIEREQGREFWLRIEIYKSRMEMCGDGNGENGNPNENDGGRGTRPVARECTYQDFMKCQPLNFKGMEGVVGLIRWFEKMETVFHISNCPEKYQVKYATCTLLNSALTWWNSIDDKWSYASYCHVMERAHEANG